MGALCSFIGKSPHLCALSPLHFSGTKAGSTNIHLFCSAIYLNSNRFQVRFPLFVASSMRVADCVTKMHTLIANCTPCHEKSTSFYKSYVIRNCRTAGYPGMNSALSTHNMTILTKLLLFCKKNFNFSLFFLLFFLIRLIFFLELVHKFGNEIK